MVNDSINVLLNSVCYYFIYSFSSSAVVFCSPPPFPLYILQDWISGLFHPDKMN